MHTQSDQINVRIDTATKKAAEAVFSQLGLSATDAIRMFYRQVSMRQGLPFDARVQSVEAKGKEKDKTGSPTLRIKKFIAKHKNTLDELAGR